MSPRRARTASGHIVARSPPTAAWTRALPSAARVVRRAAERARELGVDQELVRDVIWRIIASARQAPLSSGRE